MSKLLPAITGFACLVWIVMWTLRLSASKDQDLQQNEATPLSFSISHENFVHVTNDLFAFSLSEEQPLLTDSSLHLLQLLATWLLENPSMNLNLTGVYTPGEKNHTVYQNLGLARAEAVKSILVQKGALSQNIHSGYIASGSQPMAGGKLLGGVIFSFDENQGGDKSLSSRLPEPSVPVGDLPEVDSGRFFYFSNGSASIVEKDKPVLDDLKDYLRSDPSIGILITGYSEAVEEYKTEGNLAELRAKAVRRYLVDSGVRRRQIETASKPSLAENGKERVVTITIRQLN